MTPRALQKMFAVDPNDQWAVDAIHAGSEKDPDSDSEPTRDESILDVGSLVSRSDSENGRSPGNWEAPNDRPKGRFRLGSYAGVQCLGASVGLVEVVSRLQLNPQEHVK
jgi:hypothetical protein